MSSLRFEIGGKVHDLSERTYVMGILNVTPDSFSDGGRFFDPGLAVAHGERLAKEGADFIDVGGESTRPGAEPLSEEEEIRRVVPVITALASRIQVPISIDTYKSRVAKAALDAGAVIVNDISAGTFDESMFATASAAEATMILMHMIGSPKTMQDNPSYKDVVAEVRTFLSSRTKAALSAGINNVILDPGLGFGKTLYHNLDLMQNLRSCVPPGYPVLVGPSRKSFIGKILNAGVDERLEGTAAAVAACILRGANIVRVHDVKEMKRVAMVADALKESGSR